MKKTTTTAKSRQNRIVAALEQAQTDIRFLIKNAYLTDEPQESTNYRLQALINKAVKGISILRLRQDARRSLYFLLFLKRKTVYLFCDDFRAFNFIGAIIVSKFYRKSRFERILYYRNNDVYRIRRQTFAGF